jgi:homocitrate synthase NifV
LKARHVASLGRQIIFKDSTLREGLDTRKVSFSLSQKLKIVEQLIELGVSEAEIVAPGNVLEDLSFARAVRGKRLPIRTSGLIYANRPEYPLQLERCGACLDRVDLLMPLSDRRTPHCAHEKISVLMQALAQCRSHALDVGAGFPHSTQVDPTFLLDISKKAVAKGATRITLYDTNGSADPFEVHSLVKRLAEKLAVPLFFHGHNDLGLATANSWAAICAGAGGLDVTINGLGDRAGNASLEQLATLLHLKGVGTGINLIALKRASRLVEAISRIAVSKLAPVVGEYVFDHKSPSHLTVPTEFEAFDPSLIGGVRHMERSRRPTAVRQRRKSVRESAPVRKGSRQDS